MNTRPSDDSVARSQATSHRPGKSGLWFVSMLGLLILAGGGAWYSHANRAKSGHLATAAERPPENVPANVVTVEVVAPTAGGINRVCIQPGTIEPFEAADLYAKVSGFLMEQSVDIGSRVKTGQVLARIAVPEFEKQVERDAAKVQHAEAVVKQMEAQIAAAEADAKSAEASVLIAKSQFKAKGAYRKFREKQLNRLKELNAERAIDARIVDESEDQFEASVEAENSASETVSGAEQQVLAAHARVIKAKADLEEAKAEIKVAVADLERSRVFVEYSVITSPYDGVITKRSFHRGDFIRAADVGGDQVPLLSVERTDKMRVVVQVPDRDVPYANEGDTATVEIDALPGNSFKSVIARIAESEDAASRTMRTEVDLPNTDDLLRRGMYGRVTLLLQAGQPDAITIPSTALSGKTDGSRAMVKIVRNNVVRSLPVMLGADNGIRVEVLSGLTPNDSVIIRSNGAIDDGTPVKVSGAKSDH